MRRVLFLLVAICFAACGTIGEEYPTHEESSVVGVGDVAPDFAVELLGGERVTLAELRGEVVLLVLFSHECPDCKMLMDDMQAARDYFDDLGVRILAIERDGSAEDVETYMERNVYPYAPDAWIDEKKTKIGYEIPFTREFYKYVAPRSSADIFAHLEELEKAESALMAKIMGR